MLDWGAKSGVGSWELEVGSSIVLRQPTAVLLSAGLDSAVLAAFEARAGRVHPLYVSTGLAWESAELRALEQLLTTAPFRGVAHHNG